MILLITYKLILLSLVTIFVTSAVLYFMYRVWVKHTTKTWYKLSAILLGAVAVGVCIAQIYISIPIVLFAPLPILGLIMMVLADLAD